ncbi:MAG: ATP-grasp domain-containing protein [Clostridia bacterium]|nr:ATP-grasp domain-containing protein [Clostridia bacterium]
MQTVIITDGKYRASLAAIRALGRAGYRVIVTQTRADVRGTPPAFSSRFAAQTHWFAGSASDEGYADTLLAFLRKYDRPILFCVGAVTLNTVARRRAEFADICSFLLAEPNVLDALNDKEAVWQKCVELGISVPRAYTEMPDRYPVVIKPHCGERAGLPAAERYAVANNIDEYAAAIARMKQYDPTPLVQEKVEGEGRGVSLLLDAEGRCISAICHRRIREYPLTGGPSTCCESIYDEELIERAYRLLRAFDFVGMAMVEFKGDCVLEVNPRVWGSFPLTACAQSPFALHYARAAAGETVTYTPCDYRTGVRMRFMLNDTLATLSYLGRGDFRAFFCGIGDCFRAKEALACRGDAAPMYRYLCGALFGRRR